MRRPIVLAVTLAVLAAGGTLAQARGPGRGMGAGLAANPSAIVAAEIDLNRLARGKGQWAGMRETAAPGAQLFAPQPVNAEQFLKDRAEPAAPMDREAQEVWMSCDGRYAVATGSWRQTGATGRFVTVWQRQDKGAWKWLLDQTESGGAQSGDPDMIRAHVADCPARRAAPTVRQKDAVAPAVDPLNGKSDDGSLSWSVVAAPGGAWRLTVGFMQDGTRGEVLRRDITLPAPH